MMKVIGIYNLDTYNKIVVVQQVSNLTILLILLVCYNPAELFFFFSS